MDTTVVLSQTNYVNVDVVRDATVNIESESVVLVTSRDVETVVAYNNGFILQVTSEYNTPIVGGAQGPQGVPGEEDMPYSKRIDFITDNELYKGEAPVGTPESTSLWRIRKVVIGTDSDVTETWAGGNANFDKMWSARLSLSYS